jgi:ABC-type polysaccharide/polyol phosphate export permease
VASTIAATVSELVAGRELLFNLTSRELRVRYKRSVLGFVWSMLTPLLMMAVFSVVFGTIFEAPIDDFPLFFLAGYLPWSFFQASGQVGTGCIVANAPLLTKVYFPRVVLPLSVVLSQLVHFGLALAVYFVVLLVAGYNFAPYLPILVVGIGLLACFTVGVSMFLSALNTIFRDVQEFTTVLFLLWFYGTPVVYSLDLVPSETLRTLLRLNPLTHYVEVIRNCLYDLRAPSWSELAVCAGFAVAAVAVGGMVFTRLSSRFAKEV